MGELLKVQVSEGVATLMFNRPDKMNALNRELRASLREALEQVEQDAAVGAVILTGAGKAFCAGLDLKELGGERKDKDGAKPKPKSEGTGMVGPVVDQITSVSKPVIGAINGVAITGGFEVALGCDLLIASTQARFADTHARVGILPYWGLSQRLPRLIGINRAKELSLTGNFLDAQTAERWGLVNRVVEPEELLPTATALAKDMLSCDPATLAGYKRVIDDGYALNFADGLKLEVERSRAHAKQMRPGEVAKRRAAVQARGREQQ